MKKIMKFVKQNIVGFILGIILTGIGVVTASTIVSASGVAYSNTNSNVANVGEALDELFESVGSSTLTINTLRPHYSSDNGMNYAMDVNVPVTGYQSLTFTYTGIKGKIIIDRLINGTYTRTEYMTTSSDLRTVTVDLSNTTILNFYLESDGGGNGCVVTDFVLQ